MKPIPPYPPLCHPDANDAVCAEFSGVLNENDNGDTCCPTSCVDGGEPVCKFSNCDQGNECCPHVIRKNEGVCGVNGNAAPCNIGEYLR